MNKKEFLQKILDYFALNKPWLYLTVFCWIIMQIIFLLGNPLLPSSLLSKYGYAWHHIPEILMFFFSGVWWSEWKIFSSRKIQDVLSIIILTGVFLGYSLTISLLFAFVTVSFIFITPFLMGYLIKRLV